MRARKFVPRVLNKRDPMLIVDPTTDVYVGRPSPFGNWHRIGYCGLCKSIHAPGSAVAAFRRDLLQNAALLTRIRRELRGKNLICWCAPAPCHADVLLEVANA